MKVRGAVLREMGRPAPFAESRPLEIVELELEPPGAGEILIRVRAAGLCHSDLSVIDGSRPRLMPMVLGHEAAGEVVELGPGVSEFALGITWCSRSCRAAVAAGPVWMVGRPCASRERPPTPPVHCSPEHGAGWIPLALPCITISACPPSRSTPWSAPSPR